MKISNATFIIVDVETTGLDSEKDQVVEMAAVATSLRQPNRGLWATLVKPTIAIPPEVSAVHHLTADAVAHAPTFEAAQGSLEDFLDRFDPRIETAPPVLVAHNAAFDAGFLKLGQRPFLCTMRLAGHLWPQAPNFKNETLRYWRGLDPDTFGIASHRALGDALVTAELLFDLLLSDEFKATGVADVDALIAFADSPITLQKWPLGKFRQEPIAAADDDYLSWALGPRGMVDMSRDLRYTLEAEQKRRRQPSARVAV